jgi:hypothetical protein
VFVLIVAVYRLDTYRQPPTHAQRFNLKKVSEDISDNWLVLIEDRVPLTVNYNN